MGSGVNNFLFHYLRPREIGKAVGGGGGGWGRGAEAQDGVHKSGTAFEEEGEPKMS